ncbi:branched-chain amino acid ABC transporter permease [Zobellella iuensis]|uniref:Branched-chain amino acid ABC transporter permease n=1 Tax=Zobellella iuensis TaxID=2803811 RepID=A0ABS1QLW3_9GAMM|nr:branched-chain amino acid ABC transporter permease [Zobellella iuensis]MBL1375848.1 branched-chain amino acid ABC transporter permease [Zobellella iuensis]
MSQLNKSNKDILWKTALALLAGLLLVTLVESGLAQSLLTQATIYALFALGVGVLLRQNGLGSFGHAAFFGSSGYLLALLLQHTRLPAELIILLTLLVVLLVALVLGLLICRVPGIAFGMLTLAVGQSFFLTASRSRELLGGADGLGINWPDTLFGLDTHRLYEPDAMFLLCWGVLVLTMALLTLLLRGRFGRVTEAIRDNEERARFIGIQVLLPRAALYSLSAGITAMAGVLSALYTGYVSPESLHWSVSGIALIMVILGGFHQLWGPVLGAVVYFLVKDYLGGVTDYWMGILGMALILVVVFAPEGMAGGLEKGLRRLRFRRGQRRQPSVTRMESSNGKA